MLHLETARGGVQLRERERDRGIYAGTTTTRSDLTSVSLSLPLVYSASTSSVSTQVRASSGPASVCSGVGSSSVTSEYESPSASGRDEAGVRV